MSAEVSPRPISSARPKSLRRLQTDRIDLYQAHFDDTGVAMEETLEAFASLVKSGKAQVSAPPTSPRRGSRKRWRWGAPRGCRSIPACNRTTASSPAPFTRATCRRYASRRIWACCPFARSKRGSSPANIARRRILRGGRAALVARILDDRSLDILGELDGAAQRLNATPAQVAIAWLLAQPGVTAPIVSVTSPAQLEEVCGAATLALDAESLRRLTLVSA